MPLFKIQDSDRPLYIVAKNYGDAEYIWKKIIAKENKILLDDVESPFGISFICEDKDIVLHAEDWQLHCI